MGEPINYTLKVDSVGTGTARNVVIQDTLETEGVTLNADSIKVFDREETDLTADCQIEATERGFIIQTGKNLEPDTFLTVTYTATADESLAGKDVKNLALTFADNAEEQETPHTVTLLGPAELELTKEADKEQYEAGKPIQYTLNVKTVSDATAKAIVIEDVVEPKGVTLDAESIKVTDPEGNDVTEACKIDAKETSFRIETGMDLAKDQTMTVTYTVNTGKGLDAESIDNVATASADNAPEVKAELSIPSPDAPEEPTKPTPKNEPPADNGNAPQTGDSMPVELLIGIMAAAAIALVAFAVYMRKKAHKE